MSTSLDERTDLERFVDRGQAAGDEVVVEGGEVGVEEPAGGEVGDRVVESVRGEHGGDLVLVGQFDRVMFWNGRRPHSSYSTCRRRRPASPPDA
ncbi:MAG: hypothetical protein R2715_21745 [Ilumatobacteraceae bacterium]